MFSVITQIMDIIQHRNIFHPFLFFFLLVWTNYIYHIYMARKNKKIVGNGNGNDISMSAIVLSYNDDPKILKQSLTSLKKQKTPFDEVIIVTDEKDEPENLQIIESSGFKVLYDKSGNKRDAFYLGFKNSSGEVVAMLAGDTLYPDMIVSEAKECFTHDDIGAVGFENRIYDRKRNLIRRFASIMYSIRYKITYPCLSSRGVLCCTTGETGFFRRKAIENHMDEFITETLFGRRCIIGDDRFLTSMILRGGYRVVYQPTNEPVRTDCPNTLVSFIKQQIRWFRSNQRYSAKTLFRNWIPTNQKVLKIHMAGFIIMPYLWCTVLLWWILNNVLHLIPNQSIYWSPMLITAFVVPSFFFAAAIKLHPHLIYKPKDLLILPLFTLLCAFIIAPAFIYAGITVKDQGGWGTKQHTE